MVVMNELRACHPTETNVLNHAHTLWPMSKEKSSTLWPHWMLLSSNFRLISFDIGDPPPIIFQTFWTLYFGTFIFEKIILETKFEKVFWISKTSDIQLPNVFLHQIEDDLQFVFFSFLVLNQRCCLILLLFMMELLLLLLLLLLLMLLM